MHLVLAVEDVDRAKAFYNDAFGWRPHLEWAGTYSELQLPNDDWLGLYRRDGYAEEAGASLADALPDRQTGTELYVMVGDLDEAEQRLRAAGAKALDRRASRSWGHEASYFADPDGNVVAVARPLDEVEWAEAVGRHYLDPAL